MVQTLRLMTRLEVLSHIQGMTGSMMEREEEEEGCRKVARVILMLDKLANLL